MLQLVKLGSLQEPFNRIPPEGPLPQFAGQFFIQPPRPRPKSSAETHPNRVSTPNEGLKVQESKVLEAKYIQETSFEAKPNAGKSFEDNRKRNSETNLNNRVTFEKYDTRINITQKVNEDLVKFQTQVEISQLNEKHLREELSVKSI